MNRYHIVNPETLGAPRGFNHGLLALASGRVLFVAGQIARDQAGRMAGDFPGQFDGALRNVLEVVKAAGGAASDLGRLTIYVTDIAQYRSHLKRLGEVYRRHMGDHYPAMALVQVGALVDPAALIEIEATAVL